MQGLKDRQKCSVTSEIFSQELCSLRMSINTFSCFGEHFFDLRFEDICCIIKYGRMFGRSCETCLFDNVQKNNLHFISKRFM